MDDRRRTTNDEEGGLSAVSRSLSGGYRHVTVNGDTRFGADNGAQGAAGAFVVGVVEDNGIIAGAVALWSLGNNVRWASGLAQFAPLAPLGINQYSAVSHWLPPKVEIGDWRLAVGYSPISNL